MKYYLRRSALGLVSVSAAFLVATSVEQVEVKAQEITDTCTHSLNEKELITKQQNEIELLKIEKRELAQSHESAVAIFQEAQEEIRNLSKDNEKLNELVFQLQQELERSRDFGLEAANESDKLKEQLIISEDKNKQKDDIIVSLRQKLEEAKANLMSMTQIENEKREQLQQELERSRDFGLEAANESDKLKEQLIISEDKNKQKDDIIVSLRQKLEEAKANLMSMAQIENEKRRSEERRVGKEC